jgi:hypothetical protein
MKTITTIIGLASCVMALNACASNKPVDLGDDKTGTTAQGLAAYEGDWDGYVEAYKFESGSDRVRITLDAEGHGTIEVGDAPEIPPFTDPNVGYPPTDPGDPYVDSKLYILPHEGYGYPVGDAAVRRGRISFTFWGTDLQKDWCEAQTSYVVGGGSDPFYSCLPGGVATGSDDMCVDSLGNPIDCGFVSTCVEACSCDAAGCTSARRDPQYELQVDAALDADGKTLVGTLLLPDVRTIRLQRL